MLGSVGHRRRRRLLVVGLQGVLTRATAGAERRGCAEAVFVPIDDRDRAEAHSRWP